MGFQKTKVLFSGNYLDYTKREERQIPNIISVVEVIC